MPNFQDSKIYKIVNDSSDLVYYGSTTQPLYKRFFEHKKFGNECTSRKIFEGENPQIILVESYPCNNKDELKKKEREYIEDNNCVNKCIPGRTIKEYRETYKERYKENWKKWSEENKDKLKEKSKEYYQKNKDKIKEYQKKKIEILKIYKKEYREKNKDILYEKAKVKITCICGSNIRRDSKNKHEKSKKHQNFINKN